MTLPRELQRQARPRPLDPAFAAIVCVLIHGLRAAAGHGLARLSKAYGYALTDEGARRVRAALEGAG